MTFNKTVAFQPIYKTTEIQKSNREIRSQDIGKWIPG